MDVIEAVLPYIQIILSVLLVTTILMQQNEAGLGSIGGGGGDSFSSTHQTRRGFERLLFQATIVLSILFALSAFAALLL